MAIEVLQNQLGVLVATAAVAKYRFIKPATAAFSSTQAGVGDVIVGVSQESSATGIAVSSTAGGISKVTAGAAFSVGDPLTADSTGRAILAVGAVPIGGYAIEAATAADQIVSMLVAPTSFGEALEAGVLGVAAGYKVARGEATLDGTNPTSATTGLATVVAAVVRQKSTATPALDPSDFTVDYAGAVPAGRLDIYAWKVTAKDDATLVASTNSAAVVSWVAVGT